MQPLQARVIQSENRMAELVALKRELTPSEVAEVIKLKKLEQARMRTRRRRGERAA